MPLMGNARSPLFKSCAFEGNLCFVHLKSRKIFDTFLQRPTVLVAHASLSINMSSSI